MFRHFCLLLLLPIALPIYAGSVAGPSVGDPYSSLTIPAELKEGAHSVVRKYTYRWEVNSDRTATLYCHKIITILDDEHDDENRLVVYYDDNSKITNLKAVVYDAGGEKARAARNSDIEDIWAVGGNFDTDTRVQTVKLDHPSYPYTVEYEYKRKMADYSMVAGFPDVMPVAYDQALERADFTAVVPADNKLYYYSNELPEPTVTAVDGDQAHTWSLANLKARSYEAYSPAFSQVMPFLSITLDHFKIDEYAGSMRSWEEFGRFIGKLVADRHELPDHLRALVRETTDGLATEREKIDALYRVLQNRTRYVSVQLGIGGWQPFPAEYVEKNKYGDCKALSNYMGAMLNEIGIESYPVLITGGREFFPASPDFATSAFNHMILYVPSEDMYLECTSSIDPPGYMRDWTQDRNVLLVTPEGGKLARTPKPDPVDNSRLRTVDVTIHPDGSADYRLNNRMYGGMHDYYRSLISDEANREEQLERLHGYEDIPDVRGTEYSLYVDEKLPEARLSYATSIDRYASKRGKRIFLPLNKYDNFTYVPDKLEERLAPIESTWSRFMVDTININLPKGVEVESLGEERIEITHAGGQYLQTVTTEGNSVRYVRSLKLLPVVLPATEYEGYRQFFVDVSKAESRRIVLVDRQTK